MHIVGKENTGQVASTLVKLNVELNVIGVPSMADGQNATN